MVQPIHHRIVDCTYFNQFLQTKNLLEQFSHTKHLQIVALRRVKPNNCNWLTKK